MEEIWKPIPNYEGFYEVSNKGRIRSLMKGIIMKPYTQNSGYYFIRLYKNGVCVGKTVHRIVASTFIENPDNLPMINHKDAAKTNNCVENLEWCTPKQNAQHAAKLGLCGKRSWTDEQRREVAERQSRLLSGRKHTPEHVEKVASQLRGRKHPDLDLSFYLKVKCLETGEIFKSMEQAAKWEGCSRAYMYERVRHQTRKVINHTFEVIGGGRLK